MSGESGRRRAALCRAASDPGDLDGGRDLACFHSKSGEAKDAIAINFD